MHIKSDIFKNSPVTFTVAAVAVLVFILPPVSSLYFLRPNSALLAGLIYPFKLIFGSVLHVHWQHLLMNLIFWLAAGCAVEPKIRSKRFLFIAIVSVLFGGLLETFLFDPKFIGLSSACYGILGIIIWDKVTHGKGREGIIHGIGVVLALAVADTLINAVASPYQIAYAAHVGGLMAGFFSSLGLGKNGGGHEPHRVFRPMTDADVKAVLEIIYEHDEDDGAEAETAFNETLADKYVMEFEGRLMGMTGFHLDPDTDNTAWLSFTYIHDYFRNKGNAHWMMLELRSILDNENIERLFIATSDYVDEDTGEDIYLAARNFYENKLNAERELRVESFYQPGEAKYIYSLSVNERSEAKAPPAPDMSARFVGLDEAAESDTSYVALWEEVSQNVADNENEPKSKLQSKSLSELIDEVKSYNGKALFVTLPDYISNNLTSELRKAGFSDIGYLRDYFSKGVDEVYWGLYFD